MNNGEYFDSRTKKEDFKAVLKYWKCPTGPHSLARSVWNLSPLTQLTIYRIREKCETTSSVVQTSKYGTSLVVNENRFEICEKFEKKKKKSHIHLLDSQLEETVGCNSVRWCMTKSPTNQAILTGSFGPRRFRLNLSGRVNRPCVIDRWKSSFDYHISTESARCQSVECTI